MKRYPRLCSRALVATLLAVPFVAREAAADQDDVPGNVAAQAVPSPFSGFETHYLANGVKVWFNRLAGSPDVYVGAGVPVGSYAAPSGKSELAHFVEHMLLSDRSDRTELENRAAIEVRGGTVIAHTSRERTWYTAYIGRDEGLFAIEWLADVLKPRRMEQELVERNRLPIQIELGAKPPDMLSKVVGFLTPSRFEVPLLWETEFGPDWKLEPRANPWRGLYSITPEDLERFYDLYYAPGNMTVLVLGDLERDDVLATAERTFGSIPARPVTRWDPEVLDPGRGRGKYRWRYALGLNPYADYKFRYKLYDPSAEERLLAHFIADFLHFRINERLRFGQSKISYTSRVEVVQRGPSGTLLVEVLLPETGLAYARHAIEEEIQLLRTGAVDAEEFESNRARVLERTRAASLTPGGLGMWTVGRFHYPGVFRDVPDPVAFAANVTQHQVARYARGLFAESNRVVVLNREPPVGPLLAAISLLALLALTLALARRESGERLRRSDIIYIARLRLPIALSVGYGTALAVLLFVLAVTGGAVGRWAVARWLWPIDSFTLYAVILAAVLVLVFAGLCRLLALVPHELVVARDQFRVGSRTWRSRVLRREDIAEISVLGFRDVWLGRRLLRGLPLTTGIRQPGIYLRPRRGHSYFFRSRNTRELGGILAAWWGPTSAPHSTSPRDLLSKFSSRKLDGDPVSGIPG